MAHSKDFLIFLVALKVHQVTLFDATNLENLYISENDEFWNLLKQIKGNSASKITANIKRFR